MSWFRRTATLLLVPLALLAGVTGCATRPHSSAPPEPVNDPASSFPAKVQLPGQQPVTLPQQPKRVVSLSPTATETLYEIGAGNQVVAADEQSTFPEQAPRTKLSGLTSDAASVADRQPDLVIVPDNATKLAEGLRALDIPVLLTPSAKSLDDSYTQIETLGEATGHAQRARDVTARMRSDIDQIVRDTPKPPKPLSYYHEISPDGYSATSRTFVGSIYQRFGMTNVADSAVGDYPKLSPEHVLQTNPDLVFLADTRCCHVSDEAAGARPGWATLSAVRDGHVVELDDNVADRWGPRVVDLVRSISDAVANRQRD